MEKFGGAVSEHHQNLVEFHHISHYAMTGARAQERDLFLDQHSTPARITQSFYPVLNLRGGTELYISALYKPHVCTRPLLHFGLNSGIPVIAARAISDLVRFTNTAMFVGMSTMRQTIYIPKKLPS